MARLTTSILVLFRLASTSLAFDCSIPPIYVDIHKRVVHGTDVFQYGSFIGVGSPAQNQSLFPSLSQNETSVASIDYCKNSSLSDCSDETRGNFDVSLSSTWTEDDGYTPLDAESTFFNKSIFGQDTLHLYTHFFESNPATERVLHNFTTEVATSGNESPGVVGMGLSSTLLQELYNNGSIAGRTYSLYVGTGFDRAGGVINGSNAFGGYDAGRFTGQVYNYSMDISNRDPLSVRVSDIILDDPTGIVRNVSLFSASDFPNLDQDFEGFDAQITTDQYPLSLPYEVTQNYISSLAAVPSNNSDGSLSLSKAYNGTMTIVLSDGFRVTLPHETMYNVSGISPVAARDKNSTAPYYLSLAWLSQVYLMLDYDSYTFHLAQALPEADFVMPKTFCPKSVPQPYIVPKKGFGAEGLIGAVIGGIVGGSALIFSLWCLFVFWQKRRMGKISEKDAVLEKGKMRQFEIEEPSTEIEKKMKGPKSTVFWRR